MLVKPIFVSGEETRVLSLRKRSENFHFEKRKSSVHNFHVKILKLFLTQSCQTERQMELSIIGRMRHSMDKDKIWKSSFSYQRFTICWQNTFVYVRGEEKNIVTVEYCRFFNCDISFYFERFVMEIFSDRLSKKTIRQVTTKQKEKGMFMYLFFNGRRREIRWSKTEEFFKQNER